MLTDFQQVAPLLGAAVVLVHLALIAYVFLRVVLRRPWSEGTAHVIQRYGLLFAALIALGASFGSLYISYVMGIPACDLCWFQRTMIYPLAVMLPIAWWCKDTQVSRYVVPISIVGALVGLYQHVMQMWPSLGLACGTTAASTSCAIRFMFEFGYITFPLVGVTTCVMVGILAWEVSRVSRA